MVERHDDFLRSYFYLNTFFNVLIEQCPVAGLVLYSLVTLLVLLTEKMFHAFRETETLSQAFMNVWTHQDWNVLTFKVLCMGLAFIGYHLYAGIDRRLGEGTLKRMVLKRP